MGENFTSIYLTMLSIIQGVALTDLANIAFTDREHFGLYNWLEVTTMIWSLIYIWNHFMGDALMAHWIPDIEDALLLFGTGVLELVANHAIVWGMPLWLATLAVMFGCWAAGTGYIRAQEEQVVSEPILLAMLRRRTKPLLTMTVLGAAILGILAFATAHWTSVPLTAGACVALAISLLIGFYSCSFWRGVRRYANTGVAPAGIEAAT